MARRYDSRTTIFSPEGRLYQVEYAMEAISQAGAAIGICTKEGVVLAAEKRITSKLLDIRNATEKMYKIDSHVASNQELTDRSNKPYRIRHNNFV